MKFYPWLESIEEIRPRMEIHSTEGSDLPMTIYIRMLCSERMYMAMDYQKKES